MGGGGGGPCDKGYWKIRKYGSAAMKRTASHPQDPNEPRRPLLALSIGREIEEEGALLVPSLQPRQVLPEPLQPGVVRQPNPLSFLRGQTDAQRILTHGSLSIAAMQVGSRVYQLIVDIQGVPMLAGIGQLKSLILDSWILASNGLGPAAGRLRVEEAVVRALLMLLVKRIIGIRQLGPVRDILTLFNFIALASASMRTLNFDPTLASTLAEIASLPGLLYTAMARIVVDSNARAWFVENNTPQLRREAKELDLGVGAKGGLGRNGEKLRAAWRKTLEDNPVLRAYTQKNAVYDATEAEHVLRQFVRL